MKPQINVTPLIDVLLVLLIIFMVITPMKPSAFEAKIPHEPKRDPDVGPPPLTLVVAISQAGGLKLNMEDMAATVNDPRVMIEKLRSVFDLRTQNLVFAENIDGGGRQRVEKTVIIQAPRGLDYGSVAKVVDAVKAGGASPVSLQIDDLD